MLGQGAWLVTQPRQGRVELEGDTGLALLIDVIGPRRGGLVGDAVEDQGHLVGERSIAERRSRRPFFVYAPDAQRPLAARMPVGRSSMVWRSPFEAVTCTLADTSSGVRSRLATPNSTP